MNGSGTCPEHWALTREVQREAAVLRAQIDALVSMRSTIVQMDERQRAVEGRLAGLSARVTIALGILVPVAAGVALALAQLVFRA